MFNGLLGLDGSLNVCSYLRENRANSSPLNAFSLFQGGDASLEGFNEGLNSILDKDEKRLCIYLFAAKQWLMCGIHCLS